MREYKSARINLFLVRESKEREFKSAQNIVPREYSVIEIPLFVSELPHYLVFVVQILSFEY